MICGFEKLKRKFVGEKRKRSEREVCVEA